MKPDARIINETGNIFEMQSFSNRILYFFLMPILNHIPSQIRPLLKKTHQTAKKVIETATTHEAIEVFYSREGTRAHKNIIQRFFYSIWFNTKNPMAVRNRLLVTEREIKRAVRFQIKKGKPVRILSIASGSSRAIVESVHELANEYPVLRENLSITFLDKNQDANTYSKNIAEKTGWIHQHARWITDKATNIKDYFNEQNKPNIIEMVGLLDYFHDDRIARIFAMINDHLCDDGVLITANISNNNERPFVTNVVGWEMIYREPEDLIKLAEMAGFASNKITVYREPLGIHFILVAQK